MSFLTAQWRRLAMFNFLVPPELLTPYLPAGTEIDFWEGNCYLSLVGFRFLDTHVKGYKIPGHVDFEEVNLRFYVRYKHPQEGWRRGVVFISEIVPKWAIALIANAIYKEHYRALPMRHTWEETPDALKVEYAWQLHDHFHQIGVIAENRPVALREGSEAEFITEHYWGYARYSAQKTMEYQVKHPRWMVYPVQQWACEVDFAILYGAEFGFLNDQLPVSVFLAEGSTISVEKGALLTD